MRADLSRGHDSVGGEIFEELFVSSCRGPVIARRIDLVGGGVCIGRGARLSPQGIEQREHGDKAEGETQERTIHETR